MSEEVTGTRNVTISFTRAHYIRPEREEMKRSAEREASVERGKETVKFRRQNPVSCRFCRSKKLRCDRAQPCANCFARRISCVPASVSLESLSQGQAQANSPLTPDNPSRVRTIESRLETLEQAVFHMPNYQQPPQTPEAIEDGTISKTARWIEADAGTVHGPSYSPYADDDASPFQSPSITDRGNVLAMVPPGSYSPLSYSGIVRAMPSKEVAEVLLNHYAKNLNWVFHIIHVPTTRQQLFGIYSSLEAHRKPKSSHLALVATILAVGIYFTSNLYDINALREKEKGNSAKWRLLAEAAMSEANHLISPSIETLQADIIMSQFLPSYGQNTPLIATLTYTAHMLQLHKVDSARNRELRKETGYYAVELEIKRRIWWYIASTDWLLSFMSGPQCGTYICHPNQMNVLPPSNLDDEDLTPESGLGRPLSDPTELAYSIGKIQLARAVRELVDKAAESGIEVEEMSYEQILSSDRKLTEMLDSLPWFWRMDEASRRNSASLEKERPYIAWQRNLIHFGFHNRLSRLHRPYLARGYKDPRYAYSRMICLRSARMVIEMEQEMHQPSRGSNPDSARLWIVVHHVFVATVTLVMDYVCHKDDPQAGERKREILNCYKTLERSQEDSAIAKRGLAHLKQIMKDWISKGDNQGVQGATIQVHESMRPPVLQSNATDAFVSPTQSMDATPIAMTGNRFHEPPASFEQNNWAGLGVMQDLWQDPFDFNGVSNDPQWEALFRDLESQPGTYG